MWRSLKLSKRIIYEHFEGFGHCRLLNVRVTHHIPMTSKLILMTQTLLVSNSLFFFTNLLHSFNCLTFWPPWTPTINSQRENMQLIVHAYLLILCWRQETIMLWMLRWDSASEPWTVPWWIALLVQPVNKSVKKQYHQHYISA